VKTRPKILFLSALALLMVGICAAQNWGGWGRRQVNEGPIVYTEPPDVVAVNEDTVRTARETASHSTGTPNWTNAPGFEKDVFTFARIIYRPAQNGSGPHVSFSASPWGWITDYPDSDLNLSFRLQQMTSIKVDPDGRELKLTDPALFDYPWIYMVEVGRLSLRDEEVPILRNYLLNGGVLMVDDFWGQKQWDNFEDQMKRVLPERSWTELPMDHPIFHSVFDIKVPKNMLQTPNSRQGASSLNPNSPQFGITWEYYHDDYDRSGEAARDMHVRAWFDDKGRIMVIATHNCDNGDSWEREGEDDGFFHEFSEKRGYPLGINIIFYLMTH
jgi:hypothetical protein